MLTPEQQKLVDEANKKYLGGNTSTTSTTKPTATSGLNPYQQKLIDEANKKYLGSSAQFPVQETSDLAGTQKPGLFSPENIKKSAGVVGNFAIGAGKGVLSTARNLSSTGEKILSGIERTLLPKSWEKAAGLKEKGAPTSAEMLIPQSVTEAKGKAQKAGKFTEQVAEYLTPAGVEKGIITKAPGLVSKLPKVFQGAAELGIKAGTLGASSAAVTAAQGGTKGDIEKNAAISAFLPVIGKASSLVSKPVKEWLSTKVASRVINEFIKPVESSFNFNRNPGRGVAKEGIVANTINDFESKVTKKKEEIGQTITRILDLPENKAKPIAVDQIIAPIIAEAKQNAIDSGEQALLSRIVSIEQGLTKKFKEKGGKLIPIGDKDLYNLTPKQTQVLKTAIGKASKWTGQAFDNEANQLRVKLYQALNDAIEGVVPGTKALNGRYADLLTAEKAIEHKAALAQRHNIFSLTDTLVAGAGGLGALATGHGGLGAMLGAGALALGSKALKSTAVRTRVAKTLAKMSPEERLRLTKLYPALKNIYLESTQSHSSETTTNQ